MTDPAGHETLRYDRQLIHWGADCQRQLAAAEVVVAGLGGLGGTVAQLLARAGVGKLYLVDDGRIDAPDLNRQLLYDEADLGRPKLACATEKLRQINSSIQLEPLPGRIDDDFSLPERITIAADCLDNYAARFALEAALPHGALLVHGGIAGDQGQIVTLRKGHSQPLAEIFAGMVQPRTPIPVTGAAVTVIAALMVNELYRVMFGAPRLLDRFLVVSLDDPHLAFLDV
ncbi:MAG: ThiF family adenylyltransferase [Pelovirga sp.]